MIFLSILKELCSNGNFSGASYRWYLISFTKLSHKINSVIIIVFIYTFCNEGPMIAVTCWPKCNLALFYFYHEF